MKRQSGLAALFCALLLFTGCSPQETPDNTPANEEKIYTATASSMEGSYAVTVTLDGETIRDVSVDAHFPDSLPEVFRTQGIEAVNATAAEVVKNNAPKADMITGATVTCQAVLDGVSQCLDQAGLLKAEDYAMKDGTYYTAIFGYNDMIRLEVTIADQKISDVTVKSSNETPGVGGVLTDKDGNPAETGGLPPIRAIPEKIVGEQNLYPDIVSGATVTSYAVLTAVKRVVEDAGGNPWLLHGEEQSKEPAEDSADAVIVGAGGTGLAAAVRLAQQGKRVILVEKNGTPGGNTLVCGAIYNCPDPEGQGNAVMSDAQRDVVYAALGMKSDEPAKQAVLEALQAPVREQWEAYMNSGETAVFDSVEWYTLQTWLGGDMEADPDLVKTLCANAYDGFEWIQSLGMEFNEEIGQGAGSLWQRTHTSTMPMGSGFISTYLNQLKQYGDQVKFYTGMTAYELISENGRVTGVKARRNSDGSEAVFTASDGVLITTGGFSANSAMVQENNTSGKWPDLSMLTTTNRSCAAGDGIRMAVSAGASLTDMDQIQLLYLGNCSDGQLTKYPPRDVNGTDQIIFVNAQGERFVREDGRRDEICLAVLKQTDGMFYMLESADGSLYTDIHDPSWRSADGFTFDYLLNNGYILTDDTLEGLAEKAGMDPAVLRKTVDDFNTYAGSAAEDPFGRTLYTTKLEQGPWVMTPRRVSVHHTMGGIHIDPECRVLDEAGSPVEGLYAAGEVTGGIHGANRLGGNAVVETVVFGKLAAETIAADAD